MMRREMMRRRVSISLASVWLQSGFGFASVLLRFCNSVFMVMSLGTKFMGQCCASVLNVSPLFQDACSVTPDLPLEHSLSRRPFAVAFIPGTQNEFVGPIPDDFQQVTTFSLGITTHAANEAGAQLLLDYLSSVEVAPTIFAVGLEPVNTSLGKGTLSR